MTRRQQWRKVLDFQVAYWRAMTCEELVAALFDLQAYPVEFESKNYNVEVQLLENTEEYVHVIVGVDDGSIPWSFCPLTATFLKSKSGPLRS